MSEYGADGAVTCMTFPSGLEMLVSLIRMTRTRATVPVPGHQGRGCTYFANEIVLEHIGTTSCGVSETSENVCPAQSVCAGCGRDAFAATYFLRLKYIGHIGLKQNPHKMNNVNTTEPLFASKGSNRICREKWSAVCAESDGSSLGAANGAAVRSRFTHFPFHGSGEAVRNDGMKWHEMA